MFLQGAGARTYMAFYSRLHLTLTMETLLDGTAEYRFTVCLGRDCNGRQIRKYANFEILYLLGVTELDPLPRHIYCRVCGCWLET